LSLQRTVRPFQNASPDVRVVGADDNLIGSIAVYIGVVEPVIGVSNPISRGSLYRPSSLLKDNASLHHLRVLARGLKLLNLPVVQQVNVHHHADPLENRPTPKDQDTRR
jgi:hypothetical protein